MAYRTVKVLINPANTIEVYNAEMVGTSLAVHRDVIDCPGGPFAEGTGWTVSLVGGESAAGGFALVRRIDTRAHAREIARRMADVVEEFRANVVAENNALRREF